MFGIVTKERTFYLRASFEQTMLEWISQLKSAIKIINNDQTPVLLSPKIPPLQTPIANKAASLIESIITSTSFLTTESTNNNPEPSDIYVSPEHLSPKIDSNDSSARSSTNMQESLNILGSNDSDIDTPNKDVPKLTEEQMKDAVIHQGYLCRLKSGYPKTWKKSWCVLRSTIFTIYRNEKVSFI